MNYLLLKYLHIGLAAVSILGFMLRWSLRRQANFQARGRALRMAPHIVDTVFLLSGIALASISAYYPWSSPWLGAKIAGLIAYIALGMAAMSLASRLWSTLAFVLALVTFGWIVSVARLKLPFGVLQGL